MATEEVTRVAGCAEEVSEVAVRKVGTGYEWEADTFQ